MEFIDLLDSHGYDSIESITSMEVNPLKWNRKEWRFALDLICQACNISEAEARKVFDTPAAILTAFCKVMRKTGLMIQLTQTRKIEPEEFLSSEKTVWKQR